MNRSFWCWIFAGLLLTAAFSIMPLPVYAEELRVSVYKERKVYGDKPGRWAVRLRFNKTVFSSDLTQAVKVTWNGVEQKFEVRDPKTDRKNKAPLREYRIVPADPDPLPHSVKLVIKKWLSDASGRRLLAKDYTLDFWSIRRITARNVTTFYRSTKEKGIKFYLTGDVSEDDLKRAVRISPSVQNLSVQKLRHRSWRIVGNFKHKTEYTFEIRKTKVNKGRTLVENKPVTFKGPGVDSNIRVKTARNVVELRSRQLLPLSIPNVTKVRLNLTRVPPYFVPEVVYALREKKKRLDEPNSSKRLAALKKLSESGNAPEAFLGPFSEDAEVFFAKQDDPQVQSYSIPLSFRNKPEQGGVWLARFTDPDRNFEGTESRVIQITDLSITYKLSAKTLLLWVTSLYTGKPVPGVDLLLYQSDRYRLFVGKTDKDGLVVVKDGSKFPGVAPGKESKGPTKQALNLSTTGWVVAASAGDACAVELRKNRLKPFMVQQAKSTRTEVESTNGYIFTERGVYRPGETVFFKFVERLYKDRKISSPKGRKIKLKIVGPRGDTHYSKELTLGEFGSCHDSFAVAKFATTGTYTIEAQFRKTDTEKDVWTRTFLVAEYKRPRHFVSISMKPGERRSTDYVTLKPREQFLTISVLAEYYAGGPVKHARTRWKATLVPVSNKVKGLDGFFFGNRDDRALFLESGESMLDREGKLQLTIPMDPRLLSGLYGIKVSGTALDIDGEPATTVKTFNPKPLRLVGISNHPTKVPEGHLSEFKVIVVDQQGNKVSSGEITATVMVRDYFYTQKRDSKGNINFLWEEGWKKFLSLRSPIVNGEAVFEVELNEYDRYMITAEYADKGARYSSRTLLQVGWETYDQWIRPQKEKGVVTADAIFLAMNKDQYKTGEPVTVEFRTRRPVGRCLVTVESHDILEHRMVDVNGTKGRFRFTAKDEYYPNVYVSVIAAAGRSGFPVYRIQPDTDIPSVYFGYAKIKISSEIRKLKVKLASGDVELKGRPGEKKNITLKVTDQKNRGVVSEIAVCVVDEAVLALTNFRTPDLSSLADFFLPLSVFSGDVRLALISQDLYRLFSTKPLTGGGEGTGLVVSTIRKDFRPVAYFNPALITDKGGAVSFEFKLPDTTTAYRIYAVVCDKGAGFASDQWKMVVNKEFYIEPALPRFLIAGDRLTFPLGLNNKTDSEGSVTLTAQGQGLKVKLLDPSITIAPWDTSLAKAEAECIGGESAVFRFKGKFKGEAGEFEDAVEHTVPILSRYLPVNRAMIGSMIRKGEINVDFPAAIKKLAPGEIDATDYKAYLSLTTTNWGKIAPGLRYLLRYPYGCVEQTSSGIIPLAGIRRLVNAEKIPGITLEQVDKFLKPGMERLLSMQLESGGFSYWPGNLQPSWWGTLYATCALTLLKHDAGFEVPAKRMNKALTYIRNSLFGTESEQPPESEKWIRELAFFNLAMNNRLSKPELEDFLKDFDSLSDQGKAFLTLAAGKTFANPAGKKIPFMSKSKVKSLVSKLNPGLTSSRTHYRNSSYREVAVCLLAAAETGVKGGKIDKWTAFLLRGLKPDGRWVSTADTGWCLLALSRYFQGEDPGTNKPVDCTITLGKEEPLQLKIRDASAHVELNPRKLIETGKITLESGSKDLINYTLSLKYPDIATDPSKLKKGFTLSKKMENLNGKEEIRIGDVIRVTLDIGIRQTVDGRKHGRVDYLALEDPVPAGLVPINSDLKTEATPDNEGSEESRRRSWDEPSDFYPTHFEMRDDGVRVFRNRAWTGLYRYSYLARAVAQGEFWMRGSRISLMYNPDSFGKTKGRKVKILPAK